MNFLYSDQQELLRNEIREFIRAEVAPGAEKRDTTGKFDCDMYRRVGEQGLIGLSLPEEYGGGGKDILSYCLALEEVARVDMALSWIMVVSMSSAYAIITLGTDEQKRLWYDEWIHGIISGRKSASTGITEPEAGSDMSQIQTAAVLDDGEWVVNGRKAFITGAGLENSAGVLAVCMTDPRTRRYDTIMIPSGTAGSTMGEAYNKIGLNCSDTRPLFFDNCRVPEGNRIGAGGSAMKKTMANLFVGRLFIASTALGVAEECLDLATAYARDRFAFKRPIADFQYIQGMLTEMALNVELGRNMRDKALFLYEQGKPFFKEAAMAKWFICESATKAADNAVQIFGGKGYMNDCPVARYYRDVRSSTIAEGTTEIQRHVIAKELGLMSAKRPSRSRVVNG